MTETTQADLSASRVYRACLETVIEIERERAGLLNDVIEMRRKRAFPLPKRSHDRAAKLVTDGEHETVRLHRQMEQDRLRQIIDLASAVMADNPDFRMIVSASDFARISYHYNKLYGVKK